MKCLIFGSSLARDLRYLDRQRSFIISGHRVEFTYAPFTGKSYEYFIDNPSKISQVLRSNRPNYIIVIFGGNSISTKVPTRVVLKNCQIFFELLRESVQNICPHAKVIAHQVPLRFVYNGFKDTPDPETFRKVRNYLNHKLRFLPTIDYILAIGGSDWTRLDHEQYFRDGIHFECFAISELDLREGLLKFLPSWGEAPGFC